MNFNTTHLVWRPRSSGFDFCLFRSVLHELPTFNHLKNLVTMSRTHNTPCNMAAKRMLVGGYVAGVLSQCHCPYLSQRFYFEDKRQLLFSCIRFPYNLSFAAGRAFNSLWKIHAHLRFWHNCAPLAYFKQGPD